ncbi:MAG: hybrid sensor histidine kinase/response regulator [Thermodesulfobacteriota bacterium]
MEKAVILLISDSSPEAGRLKRLLGAAGASIISVTLDLGGIPDKADLIVVDFRPAPSAGMAAARKIRRLFGPGQRVPLLFVARSPGDQVLPSGMGALEPADILWLPAPREIVQGKIRLLLASRRTAAALEEAREELERTRTDLKHAVADREQMAKALRESNQQFQSLCNNSPDIIYTLGFNGEFTYVNPAWEKILGHGQEEVLGRYFVDFSLEEDARKYRHLFRQIRDDKKVLHDIRGNLIHKDGTMRLFYLSGAPNMDPDGEVTGMVGLLKDITENEKLQAQLLHAQKMEAIGVLAGGVAHDFNNLLQAISGYVDLLLLDLNEKASGYAELQEIRQTARRGADLTRHLLTFSRKVESKLRPISLNHEIQRVRNLLERTIPKMIHIELELAPDQTIVNADPVQIEQVLMNLGVNARDAMPEGGTLSIRTDRVTLDRKFCDTHLHVTPGDYYRIEVADTGTGMDGQTMEHIYEPFFTTKKARKGTGLGLSIVYGIIKNHGGYILCDSRLGRGTTFRVYLPVLNQEAVSTAPGVELRPTDPALQGTETVMLVDDDPMVRQTGEKILRKFGYRMVTAATGEAALKTFRRRHQRIDLVLLDVNMPGMGGKRCLEEMLKIKPDVKVIITTGYPVSERFKREIAGRIVGFIDKPYVSEALLRKTREVLDAGSG